ncbi:MAG: hypothetical protein COA82_03760 [Alkaliphilus sp.]|nr:MAG: hypothetical protein COA82_03760 [Alkaliphilus sp.]
MSCTYKAPNGKLSTLFDDVYKSYGVNVADSAFHKANSKSFKLWYGDGKMTVNGEPEIVNGTFTNSDGQTMLVNDVVNTIADTEINGQVNYLKDKFQKAGVDVNVTSDNTISEEGYVIGTDAGVKLVINPSKLKADTIFHEFGHVYIDVIGEQHPLVRKGVEELRGTSLWNRIAEARPELNAMQLGKEVLTTAIGIEAAKMYDPLGKRLQKQTFTDKLTNILRRLIRAVGNALGIHRDVASRLAYDMTGGKLRSRLTGVVSTYKQFSKVNPDDSIDDQIKDLIKDSDNLIHTADENHYTFKSDDTVRLTRATNFLSTLKHEFDRESAIAAVARSTKPLYARYDTEDAVRKLWEDKREGGTGIHLIPEVYLERIAAGDTKAQAKEYTLEHLHDSGKQDTTNDEGVANFGAMRRRYVETYIDNIIDVVEDLSKRGYKLYAEVKIADVEMGIAGTIDLLAEKDGIVHIYDWKTKEEINTVDDTFTKFSEFNKKKNFDVDGKNIYDFLGFMTGVDPTTANEYAIQLSTYKAMLENKGFKVGSLNIIPLVGEIVTDNDGNYQYENIHVYKPAKGVLVSNYSNGVYTLSDFSAKVRDGVMGKPAIESNLNKIDASVEDQAEINRIKAEQDHIKDWLTEQKLNVEKAIRRISATSGKADALAYKGKMEDLLAKMSSVDEIEALSAYSAYVTTETLRMRKSLFGKPILDDKGVMQGVTKGYASITWQEIKQLEKDDFEAYLSFVGWLINADNFVKQIVKVNELTYTSINEGGEIVNTIIKRLKDVEPIITDIKYHLAKINKELDIRYLELSRNPLFKNKNMADVLQEFFKAQVDESFFQKNLDALADTHNSYIANVAKLYQITMHNAASEAKKLKIDFDKYTEGVNIKKLHKTGKLLEKLDYEHFQKAKDEMHKQANAIADKKARNKLINDWYKANTEALTTKEANALIKKMKERLTPDEYKVWYANQKFEILSKGKIVGRHNSNRGQFFKPLHELYKNLDYDALTDQEVEVLNKIRNLLLYLTDHVKGNNIIENGYIPAIPFSKKGLMEQFKTNIGWHDGHVTTEENLIDENGDIIHILPFRFNSLLNQEPLPPIPEDATADQKAEIFKERRAIKKANQEAHAADISQDLSVVIPMFIESAIRHKHKKTIEFELHRVKKSFTENHKIKMTKFGRPVKDYDKAKHGFSDTSVIKSSKDSKIYAHYVNWMKRVFYEEYEADEGNLTKVARILQNYTSLKGMGLNLPSAINNVTYGNILSNVEAAASEFMGYKSWNKGGKQYAAAITHYHKDASKNSGFVSKTSAFVKHFNIMMDYKEQGVGASPTASKGHRLLNAMGTAVNGAYFMQGIGEHYLQNRLLLAMADSHRIKDGRIYSFQDYTRGKLQKVDAFGDTAEAKRLNAENKTKKAALKAEFNQLPTVYESFDFADGELSSNVELKKDELAIFENRVLGVNQYIHGIYNKEDSGAIQEYALGRLSMQFRKWMRPGWNKRWGTKAGTAFWNERRQAVDEGYYTTTAKFLASPFHKTRDAAKAAEEQGDKESTMAFMGNLLANYGNFIRNAKVHWQAMEDWQRANVVRTMVEYAFLCTAIATAYLLKHVKGDDEDPPFPLMMALYQMDRTVIELTTYVPMAVAPGFVGGGFLNEFKKILKSPTATFNSIENIFKLGKTLMMYPFMDADERVYSGGMYHGEDRLWTQFIKNVPFANQWYRIENIDRNYKYYKLF